MAIAKKPNTEQKAANFIGGGAAKPQVPESHKKPTMIRIDPALLDRIDQGAKHLGISRTAFIVSSAAEKLDRMA